METIELNGKKYVAVESQQGNKRIVVLQRGWVMIGDYYREANSTTVTLRNAAVIRKWGTTEGLPELAAKGKLSGTVIDKCYEYPVQFDVLTEVFNIRVDEDKWKEL